MANKNQVLAIKRWWSNPENRKRQSDIRKRNGLKNSLSQSLYMHLLHLDEEFSTILSSRSRKTMMKNWKSKEWRRERKKSGQVAMKPSCKRRVAALNCAKRNASNPWISGLDFRLYLYLSIDKIKYEPQFRLDYARTTADARIGKILIYADGEYWHSFKRAKDRHCFQARLAKRVGFKAVRLREEKFDADYIKKVYGKV
jgi:hypothetical protein